MAVVATTIASLTLAFGVWQLARQDAQREAQGRFEARTGEIAVAIDDRMRDYAQVLRGAAGLFAASERVDRAEWDAYVRAIGIDRSYPGIQGLGYTPYLSSADRAEVERRARRDGLTDYEIFPIGDREAYTPVLYLLPLNERNRRALGFDMYSEPVRQDAMRRARDSGEVAVSGAVTLMQESREDVQTGLLMYLPVFHKARPLNTIAQRRHALAGFVYSAFRMRDLMAGIVGRELGVSMQLTDITDAGAPAELYRSADQGFVQRAAEPRFTRSQDIRVLDRTWRLETASLPALEAEAASAWPLVVLASSLAISALLILIVWSLLTTRERARELASHMTVALRASEERLQLALASSHLALFDWDVAAGLVQLSPEWSAMLGGPAEPTLTPARKLELLVHPDDAAMVHAQIVALLTGEVDAYRIEHRVRRLDRSWKWIESSARVNERDKDGRALRVTGANADITERKAVDDMKNEFIATVNHELRTPLTSMLGSLALVREGAAGELPPDARKFVEIAYGNTERLAELVNDILDIERIEAGIELQIESVALDELFARALELNAPYAARFGVLFARSVSPSPPVKADADRLMQVLTNLMSNAAKHSPKGSSVTLSAEERDGVVRVSVRDEGAGIPAEFRSRLFGKFEQADRARGGTGLGLAISKALIERMEGRIGCDSEPGHGSTFWIELPRA